jgi:hypothetical protein
MCLGDILKQGKKQDDTSRRIKTTTTTWGGQRTANVFFKTANLNTVAPKDA